MTSWVRAASGPQVRGVPSVRIRTGGDAIRASGAYVLYWMTAARRTTWSYGLQHAVYRSIELGKPLLVFEPLRVDAPWSCERVHRFVVQGMADNHRRLAEYGITYFPYVEPEPGAGRGLLAALSESAALVVTDQYPSHFLPRMLDAVMARWPVAVEAVDGLGAVPLDAPERDFTVAHSFRRWLQKSLPGLWEPPLADPLDRRVGGAVVPDSVMRRWPAFGKGRPQGDEPLPAVLTGTPGAVDQRGGERQARQDWKDFLATRFSDYPEDRSHPDDACQTHLSPALHFGQIGVFELLADLIPDWDPDEAPKANGKRHGWWLRGDAADAFLDQILTWRELGAIQAHREGAGFTRYDGLPTWAQQTLDEHRSDPRARIYSLEQLAASQTDDPIWNAAQRELVQEGRIHNALRMLWGKKVLGWTRHPEEAFEILVELNNRYALDGRDPNSFSGIGWVFGRFDRAWGPERPIYGKVRYMTSASSKRKWRMNAYLQQYGRAR